MIRLSALILAIAHFAQPVAAQKDAPMDLIYVGSTAGKDGGIFRLEMDPATGKLTKPVLAAPIANPSFLAIHPTRRLLYCVNEANTSAGKKGAVTAFTLDQKTGELKQLNQQLSVGGGPCHLTVDPLGQVVLAANYGGGSVISFPLDDAGQLGEAASFLQHKGKSVNKTRQEAPHAHSINVDPSGRFALAADLGLDQVLVYRIEKGKLVANDPPFATLAPGAGPRHLDINKKGDRVYVVNELDSTVSVFAFDDTRGTLKKLQTITTLPKDVDGAKNYPAEIRVHPTLNLVFASNRGHDSIAVFKVNPADGTLNAASHQSHLIKTPRNFTIHGDYLLAASQATGKVIVFRIDAKNAELVPTDYVVDIPAPVCVRVVSRKS